MKYVLHENFQGKGTIPIICKYFKVSLRVYFYNLPDMFLH